MYKKLYYILIITVLLLFISSCIDEEKNKEHIINNEELSAYLVIQPSTNLIYNFEDELEETTRFNMFIHLLSKTNKLQEVNYTLDIVNLLGEETTYNSKHPVSIPQVDQLIFNTNIGGNGFSEFFIELEGEQNHNFYEKFINISAKDVTKYKDEFISDLIELKINYTEDEEKYNLEFEINANEDLHLDFQTYLISSEVRIYPFLGVYGYNKNEFPLSINNNYIYKEMDMLYLYLNFAIYNNDGEKVEIKARILLSDLFI